MDSPNRETWSGSTATTTEVVRNSVLFTGSDCRNLAPNMGTSIALLIDSRSEEKGVSRLVRENRKRKIMEEEFNTCRCLAENLERIVSNRKTLIEFPSHCIKKEGVSRRRGVGIGCESNSPLAID